MARRRIVAGAVVAVGTAAALTLPAGAIAAPVTATNTTHAVPAPTTPDDQARHIQKKLRLTLGAKFAGAWVAPDGKKVVVATTDSAKTAEIRRAGAEPKKVARSEGQLNSAQAKLNRSGAKAPKSVSSWYVDPKTNVVVVQARSVAAGKKFVAASGADAEAVRVVQSSERPRPLYDIVGGERYWTTQYGCSVAFSVEGGFITAGHCGNAGETTSGANQVAQGTFGGSSFPGDDYAWVDTNSQWTPTPKVNRWNGTYETVRGAQPATVGTAVCRSGSTTNTKLWCGSIQQLNATVNYPEGTVNGLIRTNICANPGDSGGSLITQTGGQAQGITSGGSGSCPSGGTTYFQPVTEVLQILKSRFDRDLVVDGGQPPGGYCDGYTDKYNGTLSSGASQYQPAGGSYTTTASGAHTGCVDGPDGVDFDLYLQKRNSSGTWANVASSTSPGPDEKVSYNGTAGTYRYRVHAYSGSGNYAGGLTKP